MKEKKQSFVNKTKSREGDVGILVLVRGKNAEGNARYAYAVIAPEKYFAFKEAEKNGRYNLAEFGEVVAQGEGEPMASIKAEMEEKYGADHGLEDKLMAAMQELKALDEEQS
ncbi:MAG: hypothetical protein EB060_05865 [Proteobacteria bacterium]|nr:hypothetical protein [Pseudomonadota bacterium]